MVERAETRCKRDTERWVDLMTRFAECRSEATTIITQRCEIITLRMALDRLWKDQIVAVPVPKEVFDQGLEAVMVWRKKDFLEIRLMVEGALVSTAEMYEKIRRDILEEALARVSDRMADNVPLALVDAIMGDTEDTV